MKKTQRLTAVFLLLLILCGCSTPTAPDTIVMPQTSAGNPHRTRACFSRTGTRRVSSGIRADRAAGAAFGRHGADRAGRYVPSRRRFGDGACARAPDGGGKKRRTPGFRAARSISTRSARTGQAGRGCSAEACRRAISMRSETSGSFQRSRRASLRWPTMTPRSPCRRSCSCRRSTPTAFSSCAGLKAAFV